MAKVLTTGSVLICSHSSGRVTLKAGHQLLTVDGRSVLRTSDLVGSKVAGCTNNPPCQTVTSVLAGASTKLLVGGEGVLLDSANGVAAPAGTWSVSAAGQKKLEAA